MNSGELSLQDRIRILKLPSLNPLLEIFFLLINKKLQVKSYLSQSCAVQPALWHLISGPLNTAPDVWRVEEKINLYFSIHLRFWGKFLPMDPACAVWSRRLTTDSPSGPFSSGMGAHFWSIYIIPRTIKSSACECLEACKWQVGFKVVLGRHYLYHLQLNLSKMWKGFNKIRFTSFPYICIDVGSLGPMDDTNIFQCVGPMVKSRGTEPLHHLPVK